jgi:predicted RNA-binding protein with RPS1 domain
MLFCGILHLSRGKKIMKKGDIVYGIITNIIGYGAFVTVNDYTGLIHISEFSDNYVRNISDFVEVGEKVKLKVIEVDEAKKRLKLSYKTLNKVRGIKGEVPKFTIGFKSLRDRMPQFIKDQKDIMKEEAQN